MFTPPRKYGEKMRKIVLKKKSGGNRIVYAPSHREKAFLRMELLKLNQEVLSKCDMEVVHGFCEGKSPVSNALPHIGYQYTLNMDLKDFFDNVTVGKVNKNIQLVDEVYWLPHEYFIDGIARQGLPTSPALANLAMIKADKLIKRLCRDKKIVYTRYADDLSFSSNNLEYIKHLRDILPKVIKKYGFEVNAKKTRIQWAGAGRRNITGVYVDDKLHVSRKVKRNLRAALHQGNKNQAKGLKEWSKLKLPTMNNISKADKTQVRHLARKLQGIKDVW